MTALMTTAYLGLDLHANSSTLGVMASDGTYQGHKQFSTTESELIPRVSSIDAQEKRLAMEASCPDGQPARSTDALPYHRRPAKIKIVGEQRICALDFFFHTAPKQGWRDRGSPSCVGAIAVLGRPERERTTADRRLRTCISGPSSAVRGRRTLRPHLLGSTHSIEMRPKVAGAHSCITFDGERALRSPQVYLRAQ